MGVGKLSAVLFPGESYISGVLMHGGESQKGHNSEGSLSL